MFLQKIFRKKTIKLIFIVSLVITLSVIAGDVSLVAVKPPDSSRNQSGIVQLGPLYPLKVNSKPVYSDSEVAANAAANSNTVSEDSGKSSLVPAQKSPSQGPVAIVSSAKEPVEFKKVDSVISRGDINRQIKQLTQLKSKSVVQDVSSDFDTADINNQSLVIHSKIIGYAEGFLGTAYLWGGTTQEGFDCSGFVQYVYRNFGIKLNRVAEDQAKQGHEVNVKDLQPGDLVFFDTTGLGEHINHVGMYIGEGRFIQASSAAASDKVVISDLSSGFYANSFLTARRYIS